MSWLTKIFRKGKRAVNKLKYKAQKLEDSITEVIPDPIWTAIKTAVAHEAKRRIPGAKKAEEVLQVVKSTYPNVLEEHEINLGIEAAVSLDKLKCKILCEEAVMAKDKELVKKKPWYKSFTIFCVFLLVLTVIGSWWTGHSPDEALQRVSDMLVKYAVPIETILGLFAARRSGLTT